MARSRRLLVASLTCSSPAPVRAPAADFPVTITAGNGKVTIRKQPRRIVSLSPTATETLFAIGAGKQVVAVDDQSDYPKRRPAPALRLHAERGGDRRVQARPRRRRPTTRMASSHALGELGIPVLVQDAAADVRRARTQQIKQLGRVTGHAAGRRDSRRRMKTQIARLVGDRRASARRPLRLPRARPRLLLGHVEDVHRPDLRAVRPEEHRRRGGLDAATGYPQLSAEYIVAQSPDLIVLADIEVLRADAGARSRRGRAGSSIDAVRTGIGRPDRRLDRVALGAARRQLRPRRVDGDRRGCEAQ